ncbi:5-hydroxytryptamine receptor 1 [Folsomia candida]|uniref:5-hydroxytryptamine receptor 1 n=1 Tax=Folsomia candida TaxID=158441 RepID=A0A226E018_FOLCA|nr:5-hydroxytryptamine receptor 1 [Folsomia candida]
MGGKDPQIIGVRNRTADVLCCTASILNLCGISLDRYRAITTPLEYSAKTTPRRMMGIIFVVWLLSACVSLPPVLLLGNVHTDPKGESFCSVSQDFWYQIYATIASFYAPLLVMLVVYFKILRVVADKKKQMSWKATTTTTIKRPSAASSSLVAVDKKDSVASAHSHYGRSSGSPLITVTTTAATPTRNGHSVRGNTAAMVVAMSNGTAHGGGAGNNNVNNNKQQGTNGVYFFPTTTLHRLKKDTDAPVWVWSVFNWLGYSNSALNPLIYATLNRDFRRPFKEILCFRCATLDSLMRREFYHQQYGDDKENVARKLSRAHVAIANASALDDSDQIHDPVRV